MPRKRHTPEEIVAKLRQVDVLVSQGRSVADAIRAIGVTEVTYYRWRQEYGGLKADQVKRLKPACLARLQGAGAGGVRAGPRRFRTGIRTTGCADHGRDLLR